MPNPNDEHPDLVICDGCQKTVRRWWSYMTSDGGRVCHDCAIKLLGRYLNIERQEILGEFKE